jgi:S-methylmethionine-dependent homocysteine/selenocysteine methylase
MQKACKIAIQARDNHGSGSVAGSLGPLGFSYQPDKCPEIDIAAPIYETAVKQQSEFVDFHILETMSSVKQARGGLMGATSSTKPVWLAISVDDIDGSRLRSGENVKEVLPLVEEFGAQALLLNCSSPEAITKSIPLLSECRVPIGAYANGFINISDSFNKIGSTVDLLEKREDLTPVIYADFAEKWVDAGATLIGGCCEVGPAHIKELSTRWKG